MDGDPTPKYSATGYDQSGLEAVPMSGLEAPDWHHQQQQKEVYTPRTWEAPQSANPPVEPKQRILGLSVRAFWIVVVLLVLIVAGAIGGGVGGGMAAQNRADSSRSAASNQSATSSPAPTTEPPQTTTPTSTTKTTNLATTTTSQPAGAVSPAPTDAGCPNINGTAYTPVDASGKAMSLRTGAAAQSFLRFCNTNWPSGADYGNPGTLDLVKLYLPSLEACITACAEYNVNYESNLAKGVRLAGGLCRAATVVKTAGEYCYLKNNTGTVQTWGQPTLFSSAMLYVGGED